MATALKSGRPQIIIPFAVDQHFQANRLYKLGYSLNPLKELEVTKEELVNRFNELENNEVKKMADRVRECLSNEDGTENAIKYIETYIKKK